MSWRLVIVAVWVAGLLVAGHRYASAWQSNEAIWAHAIAVNPRNPRAQFNYAVALAGQGRFTESARAAALSLKVAR